MNYNYIKSIFTTFICVLLLNLISPNIYAQHDLYGLWAKKTIFGSGGSAQIATSIVDDSGNIYMYGSYTGTLNFSDDICNPKIRTATATQGDLFIIKYNKEGKYQWDVVINSNNHSTQKIHNAQSLYYSDGKLLVNGVFCYNAVTTTLPTTLNAVGSVNTKVLSSASVEDGRPAGSFCHVFFQIIDTETGKLQASISEFPTGTSDVYSARIVGDDIVATHFGWASIYESASPPGRANATYSAVSSFKLSSNRENYTINFSNVSYPGQPMSLHPNECDGSRTRDGFTMANGEQILTHYAHDYTDNIAGAGTPAYYLLKYSADFQTKQAELLISAREVDAGWVPKAVSDGSNNVYLLTNFGHSKYWNTHNPVANTNVLTNYLGSGNNYTTNTQHNKILLARLDNDLTYTGSSWVKQIGSTGTGGSDMVYGQDIKSVGNNIYITGQFKGTNVPFGNGKTLTSSNNGNNFDCFYAVYDNTSGACLYAVNIGGAKNDISSLDNTTLYLSSNAKQVLIGGTYKSLIFQPDPSNRLYALSGNGVTPEGFLTLYSTIPSSTPIPYPSSYGDAPVSYGTAVHHAYPCVRLGNLDMDSLQISPVYSIDANSSKNDDGIDIDAIKTGGYINLSHADFKLDAAGNLKVNVKVHNATSDNATVIGWIDFNQNGIFDGASEASSNETVTSNTSVTLTWSGANAKLLNGKTYMRLRITTDNIDNTQPSGLFFNGEVEDYLLNFDILEVEKIAVSTNAVNTRADIGDTITYSITVTNKTPAPINNIIIYDPVPEFTDYITGSAKKGAVSEGALTNLTLNGQSVPSILWNNFNLAAGAQSDVYSFKVVLTESPRGTVNDTIIPNIAFVTNNGDTISSAGVSCNMGEIIVNGLYANNDYYAVFKNDSINSAPISLNDTDPDRNFIRDSILNVDRGTASLNAPRDGTLKYITETDYIGLDSIDYRIKTANDSVDGRAYVAVIEQKGGKYFACPAATIAIGVLPDNDSRITYDWFKTATGGTSFKPLSPTADIVMGNNDTTFYVQVTIDGNIASPRLPITVYLSETCGTTDTTDCIKDGTILFREDFGGNTPGQPYYSATGLPTTECSLPNYSNNGNLSNADYYTLTKVGGEGSWTWRTGAMFDHTANKPYASTDTVGYYLLTQVKGYDINVPQQFYQKKMDGLCEGTRLYFSVWALNYNDVTLSAASPTLSRPALRFEILDQNNDIVASYVTGNIEAKLDWTQYGFPFEVPAGLTELSVRIINDVKRATGGLIGIALDDIEVRLCAPPVAVTVDTICEGTSYIIQATYPDDGTFGNPFVYRLEYQEPNSTTWTTVKSGTEPSGTNLIVSHTVNGKKSDEGNYRMLVANASTINKVYCRASSDTMYLQVNRVIPVPDIRVQACPADPLNLTKYIDTVEVSSLTWSALVPGTTINSATGVVNNAASLRAFNTYAYKYTLTSACTNDAGTVYVTMLDNEVHELPPDTVLICFEQADVIQLNQIVGIDANGTWEYDAALLPLSDYISVNSSGGVIFNGKKAYNVLGTNGIHGGVAVRIVKFKYKPNSGSCIGSTPKEVVVILTPDITL